ncbi:hypothetical protein VCHA34P116_110005 [Vibrio chagasii]|nr:hypothetical protein VCHA34P116_110005 [Vibrio chagasii]CAH6837328.1 hypothetical protein VCHA35O137_10182 [Vibrio chagasii]CAH6859001.1 hypothetical protein VCHA32P90_10943 [Vibrio chagasii]CAH7023220.1 hypothetical protein VCHA39P230_10183 [Vibrio chagasii]CAH7126673.1 hypothetical protein VCHA53O469_10941 [Vibrio chagasii]
MIAVIVISKSCYKSRYNFLITLILEIIAHKMGRLRNYGN